MRYSNYAFRYKQFNQEYISLVLPFKVVNSISDVLIYGKHKYGYQRNLNEKHYKAIKKQLLENTAILPTSIILSVNRDYIEKKIESTNLSDELIQVFFDTNSEEKQFRIVDGQHRLKGLEEAAKDDETFNDYRLNVVILITEPSKRVVEIDVFRDINSLAKKINTDLTVLAKYNYEILGEYEISDIVKHVSVKTAYYLNEEETNSVWHKGVKFDIHDERPLGIINISPFSRSIEGIVRAYIEQNRHTQYSDSSIEIINYTEKSAKYLANFINAAWTKVKEKWYGCFKEQTVQDMYEYTIIYYDNTSYLQKTTGTNAIHMILNDCIKEAGFTPECISLFSNVIRSSEISSDDWRIGGLFSGLTSSSGFKKAKNMISKG